MRRPLLEKISEGRDKLEEALDAERRFLIHSNEERLSHFMVASQKWFEVWPEIEREIVGCSLQKAHEIVVRRAENILPFKPGKDG